MTHGIWLEMIESLVLLQTIGGDCPEDLYLLAGDSCLERGLGYQPPKPTAGRGFLERFHDSRYRPAACSASLLSTSSTANA